MKAGVFAPATIGRRVVWAIGVAAVACAVLTEGSAARQGGAKPKARLKLFTRANDAKP